MNPISKYPNNQILITQSPNNLHKHRLIKKFIYIIVFVILGLWQLSYSQDDYLEIKGDTRVDTLTFSGDRTGDASAPVRGELFYNSTLGRPHYFDGTGWREFRGQDRYVATLIVAASNSLDTSRADEGYVCDGTDDQETINRAINDLPASGGAVYLLEGTYNISAALLEGETIPGIVPHTNTAIIGTGRGTVLRVTLNESNVNVINASNVNRILISQLMIDGNSRTGTINNGIYFNSVTYSKIDKVWVENMSYSGVCWTASSNNNIISNSDLRENGKSSAVDNANIYLYSSSSNIISGNIISGNISFPNNLYGIHLRAASNNNIIHGNNIQSNNSNGIYINGGVGVCANNIILGNNFQANNGYGISLYALTNHVISSNNVQGNVRGIAMSSANANTISSNNVQGNSFRDIELSNGSDWNILLGNEIYTSLGDHDGIRIDNAASNIISANLLYGSSGTTNYPINIVTGNNNYLVGNLVSAWPGNRTINDSGTNTQYTDKVKMTLERRVDHIGFPPLDVTTNPRSYVYLIPPSNINLTLIDGKAAGDLLIIENGHAINTITVDDIGGNINLEAQRILHLYDILKLIWNGNRWLEMEFANNTPP